MSFGVLIGTMMPIQGAMVNPGTVSATVGMSGSVGIALRLGDRERAQLAGPHVLQQGLDVVEPELHLAADQRERRRARCPCTARAGASRRSRARTAPWRDG